MSIAKKLMAATGAGGWDISQATFDGGATYGALVVANQASFPTDLFFRSDGLKLYVCGSSSDAVHEYDLSSAWQLSSGRFVQSFSVSAQDTQPQGLFFSPDGLNMYVLGDTGNDVNQYTLGTAWNISTASYVRVFSVSAQDTAPRSLFFSPDGLNMYVLGDSGNDVNQYTLGTAWNISTASYVRVFSVSAQDTAPNGLFFSPDGLNMYVSGTVGRDINQYTLGTAWNISTASYVRNFVLSTNQGTGVQGVFFRDNGTQMFIVENQRDTVWNYDLSTAWNISTASPLQQAPTINYFSVLSQEGFPQGLFISPNGGDMYVTGSLGDDVNQYSLSTPWKVETASFVRTRSVSAQETSPTGVFFSPDGLNMYIIGTAGDDINQYSLSTAWNVSTTAFVRTFSVAARDTSPSDLYFRSDGLKLYFVGTSSDSVHEYTLSTAWNISTATFVQAFSVAAQQTFPYGLYFKPDGTKMFVIGGNALNMNEYVLSTPWNVSTAVLAQNFLITPYDSIPHSLSFKSDGSKMYVLASNYSKAVWAFDL